MPTPPPSPVPTRRLPAWLKVVGISIGAILLTAIIGIVAAYSFIFSLFEPAPAPHGWRNVSAKHPPQDDAFLGTWRPGELGRTIPFADGTPHTLEPDDALTLLPDHTYHFIRRGIYDGRSRLLCLRSETGRWAIRPQPGDHPPQLSLVADTPSIRIEHRVIPDLNMDNVNYNDLEQQHKSPGSPSINPQDPKSIDDQTNAMNCSSSSPRDLIGDWNIAARHGQLGIFRNAPAAAYNSDALPGQVIRIDQILYQHDPPAPSPVR